MQGKMVRINGRKLLKGLRGAIVDKALLRQCMWRQTLACQPLFPVYERGSSDGRYWMRPRLGDSLHRMGRYASSTLHLGRLMVLNERGQALVAGVLAMVMICTYPGSECDDETNGVMLSVPVFGTQAFGEVRPLARSARTVRRIGPS